MLKLFSSKEHQKIQNLNFKIREFCRQCKKFNDRNEKKIVKFEIKNSNFIEAVNWQKHLDLHFNQNKWKKWKFISLRIIWILFPKFSENHLKFWWNKKLKFF